MFGRLEAGTRLERRRRKEDTRGKARNWLKNKTKLELGGDLSACLRRLSPFLTRCRSAQSCASVSSGSLYPPPAMPTSAFTTWHDGELAVQKLMGLPQRVPVGAVVNALPEEHRVFHSSQLSFLATTTIDEDGRPWASILTSRDGLPGFITSPSESSLAISAHVWDGDPIVRNVRSWTGLKSGSVLVSAVGLETTTRRRNKLSGLVQDATLDGWDLKLHLHVNQALG